MARIIPVRNPIAASAAAVAGTGTVNGAAAPLYSTDFTEYSVGSGPTDGSGNEYFRWNGVNAPGDGVQVVDTGGGTRALRFRWNPLVAMSEMRFRLPTRQTEVWFRQTVTIPSNFVYNVGTASDEGGRNNKMFIALWSAHENSSLWVGDEDYGGSQRGPGHDINAWPPDGGTELCRHTMYMWGPGMDTHAPNEVKTGNGDPPNEWNVTPLFVAADVGQTIDFFTQLKYASAADNDGIIKTWKVRGGVVYPLLQLTNVRSYVSGQLGFNYGYMMGYANARFSVITDILMHHFSFANSNVWGVVS